MKRCIIIFCLLAHIPHIMHSQNISNAPDLDSLKIAFVSYRTGSAEVYLMNSDGTDVEQITQSPENNSFPFQINARTLGFTRIDSSRNMTKYKIDIYTGKEELLEENPTRQCSKWEVTCPNDRLVAFVRSTDYSDRELLIFDKTTGLEKQLTSHLDSNYAAYSINHSWSSDGKKLVFMSGKDWYNQVIRIYDVLEGTIYPVTDRGYMNSGLKWLADNNTLIANLKIRDETLYELYSVDTSTGTLTQLTKEINLHPDVSPDGEWIVFESQRHANDGEVYIMKKDGSNQIRLTNNDKYNGRCIWFKL